MDGRLTSLCTLSASQRKTFASENAGAFIHRTMNTKIGFSLLTAAMLALNSAALAGSVRDYQVTGPILEVNDSMIVVQKDHERWEIARDANTKATGEMKVGDKVTVHYSMTAKNIEVKTGKGKK
jgi:hypothetical protein